MNKYEEAIDLLKYYYEQSRKYKKLQKYNCDKYIKILEELVSTTAQNKE
ncbi:hypothetical protein [Criibacterium bergeronii]|nr:hypothetical protein [Criibacterium bergeronii]